MVAALAVGCGGDDAGEDPSPEQAPVTETAETPPDPDPEEVAAEEQRFIRAADRICERANEEIAELDDVGEAVRIVQQGREDLDRLDVPPSLEVRWRQYLEAVDQQQAHQVAGDFEERNRARDRKSEIALEIGFAVCGTG